MDLRTPFATEETVRVNASLSYDVIIGKNLLARAGELTKSCISPCRSVLVTDDNVDPLYSEKVVSSLAEHGFETVKFVIPNGEASKSIENYAALLSFCAENGISRSDCLFALGGGVVGDLTGFVAATYLRGVRFVQLPTTLLAAVDSSVGGKTAIDLPQGKNLVGAFYQPSLVICDYATLDTLTPSVFADGCAEVIKYGIINDRELFEALKTPIRSQLGYVIARCVKNKRDIVALDERDNSCRQLLNLGHTIGHGIEVSSDFSISHGSAVAIGTVVATRAAVKAGLCPERDLESIVSMTESYSLPTKCPYSARELFTSALSDKKRKGDTLTLVLPYGIGDTRLYNIRIDELEEFLDAALKD